MARKPKRRGAGEGSIFQRKDGRWQGELFIGIVAGKRTRKTVYGLTQGEVRVKLDELKEEKRTGKAVASNRLTVGQFLQGWIETEAAAISKPATLLKYRYAVRVHLVPSLGSIRLQRLTRDQVSTMYGAMREKGLSPNTIRLVHAVLSKALDEAVETGKLGSNPATKAKRAKVEPQQAKRFTWEHATALLTASADDELKAFWHLAVYTGCRCGELLGLQWDDIDLPGGRLTIRQTASDISGKMVIGTPKTTRSRRTLAIPAEAVTVLQDLRAKLLKAGLAAAPWVFPGPDGNVLHRQRVRQSWLRVSVAAKLTEMTIHDTRHLHTSLMLAAGVNIRVLSQRLGHFDPAFTMRVYGHLLDNADAEGVQAFSVGLKNAVPVNRAVIDAAEASADDASRLPEMRTATA